MKTQRPIRAWLVLALAVCLFTQLVSAEPLPNAWQITHNTTASSSTLYYSKQLTTNQLFAATNSGFRFTVNARLVNDYNDDSTMTMVYGLGGKRFLIWWDLNNNNDLTVHFDGTLTTLTLTTNGTGSALYHTHEIIFTNGTANYMFDGMSIAGGWTGSDTDWTAGLISWGAGSSGNRGQMNFHRVTFQVTNTVFASYDAGTDGNPVNALSPTNSGWTLVPSSPPDDTAVTNISPDTALLPLATTLAADQFMAVTARLNGRANPRGSPAMAWFEWGTTLAYGNTTAPQPVGNGIVSAGFSDSINGLVVGTNYHFRAVVSNAFGVVNGTNQTFNLGVFLPGVTTQPADQLTSTSARFNGLVNPQGWPTVAWFEWGTTIGYGNVTVPQPAGSGISAVGVSNVIGSLLGGTDYYFRIVASNQFGVAAGANQSFTSRAFVETDIPSLPGVFESSVVWGDYDNDGRLDFLLTGLPISGGPVSQLWRNTGSGFTNVPVPGLTGVYRSSVAWGDYDNDGRLDFLLTGATNRTPGTVWRISQLWRNTGSGFSNVTASVAPGLPAVDRSSVAWGDYDNDGRLDFLVTGETNETTPNAVICQLWRNTGSRFSNVTASVAPGLPGVESSSVAWGDYDNDGRLDFLLTGGTSVNSSGAISQLWRNTGSGFTNVPIPGLPGVTSSSVAWGDYDNDGQLDFVLTGRSSDEVSQLWRNTYSGFSNVTATVIPGIVGIQVGSVAWGDYDNDGRLDLLLAGYYYDGSVHRISRVWRNMGSGFSNVTASAVPSLPGVEFSSVAWGDFDNDGRLDFLLTGYDGSDDRSQLWWNNVALSNAPPAAPGGLSAATVGTTISLNWNVPADDHTPAAGLNYNVRIGSTPGASDVLAPRALTNGLRLLPVPGNAQTGTNALFNASRLVPGRTYYWSVQAIDTGFAGSPFATEQQFHTAPLLISPTHFASGVFEFYFTNQTPLNFQVLVSTNVGMPLAVWTSPGTPTPLSGGLYRFTDPGAIGQARRYYILRSQ